MDTGVFRIDHGSDVYVVRSYYNEDGSDLLALGDEHSVEVYQIVSRAPFSVSRFIVTQTNIQSSSSTKRLASFHIGTRVTAIAWSPRTSSPSSSDAWHIEFVLLPPSECKWKLNLRFIKDRSSWDRLWLTSADEIFIIGGAHISFWRRSQRTPRPSQ
jgi:hypothetical protein